MDRPDIDCDQTFKVNVQNLKTLTPHVLNLRLMLCFGCLAPAVIGCLDV